MINLIYLFELNRIMSSPPHICIILGMIRSSMDNPVSSNSSTENSSPAKPKSEQSFTPGVRQFSAPKAFRDE